MKRDKYVFSSSYKEIMVEYIDYRKVLYTTEKTYSILKALDKYMVANSPKDNELSKEYIEKWLIKKENESNNTLYQRAILIKDFTIYLNQHGVKAYIINIRNYKYIQELLCDKLGTKVKVRSKKIEINFQDLEDFNRIMEILGISE